MELNEPRPELTVAPAASHRENQILDVDLEVRTEETPLDDQEYQEEFKFYSREVSMSSLPQYIWRFARLLPQSLALGSSFLYLHLMNSVGFHFASKESRDASALDYSEFSIAMFVGALMVVAILSAIIEKATIDMAVYYGNGQTNQLRRVIWEGFLGMWIFNLLFLLPLVYSATWWVWIFNYQGDSAFRIRNHLIRLFWTFAVGQSVIYVVSATQTLVPNSHILSLSVLNLLSAGCIVYWCCWHVHGGLDGWYSAYFWHQTARIIIYIPYCLYQLKALKLFELQAGLTYYKPWLFLWESKLFLVGTFTEQIALEVATYLTVLTKDYGQVAAQTAFANMECYVYNLGVGFFLVGRSRFAYFHEKSASIKTALRFFCNFFIGLLVVSAVDGYLDYTYAETLLDIFAGKNELVRHYLGRLLKLYAFALFSDFSVNFLFCLLRCINKLEIATLANFLLIVGLQLISGLVLVLVYHKDVVWIMANFYIIQIFAIGLALIVLLNYKKPEELQLLEQKELYYSPLRE